MRFFRSTLHQWLSLSIFASSMLFIDSTFAMIGGTRTGDEYLAVGSLISKDAREPHCTATLISKDWIVSAAHCLEGGPEDEPTTLVASDLYFQIGENGLHPEKKFRISKVVTFDQSQFPNLQDKYVYAIDILFAKLESPVESIGDRSLIPIELSLASLDINMKNNPFEIVGFGQTNSVGFGEHSFTRLKADYKMTSITGNAFLEIFSSEEAFLLYLKAAHPGEENAINQLLEKATIEEGFWIHAWDARGRERGTFQFTPPTGLSNSCHGDSGGPFISRQSGRKQVRGVVIRGFNGATLGCVELGSMIAIFGEAVRKTMIENEIPFIQ